MRKLKISAMKNAIKHTVIRMNKRLIIKGSFGIGKSAGANQAVEELNEPGALQALLGAECPYKSIELIDIRLGQYDSVDLRGFPHPDKATGTAIWYPPNTMPFIGNDLFADDVLYLIFLDEFTSASTAVFAVCYQLILDGCIGEHVLKDNVRIVMAGNLDTDKGVVNKIPMPLNNRMTHVEAINPVDDFCIYAQSVGAPNVAIAFWKFKETMVNTYDPKIVNPVVATQRSWLSALDYFQDGALDYDLKEAMMVGTIGEGPTTEFLAFNEVWKTLVPIKEIIANPKSVALPAEPSLRFAMAMHVSGNMNPKNIGTLHEYLVRMPPEFVVMAWQLATERDKNLFNTNPFLDYMKRYRDVYKN